MSDTQDNNPLHGLTLQKILEDLEQALGFEKMGQKVKINCFTSDPSIKSSLKFLRKTPWAREKVEQLYLSLHQPKSNNSSAHSKNKSHNQESPFVWPDLTRP
jgi:uncharacterized protein (DUF2132 family)